MRALILPAALITFAAVASAVTTDTRAQGNAPVAATPQAQAFQGDESASSASAPVVPGVPLQFPRDFGSHPQFGIEWWYVTGWLSTAAHRPLGFQITFFRVKPQIDEANPSAFTPRQLLIAHCALSDPAHGRLWEDQRIRRAGMGLVAAAVDDTDVWIDDWRLARSAAGVWGRYETHIAAEQFSLDLLFDATSAPMLNGIDGFSQKGPQRRSASYYYSQPHLRVSGTVTRAGHREQVGGEAWLDHEWASEYLDPRAQGWDWVGLDLDDGGALMAFEIRDRQGHHYWAGATLRDAQGHTQVFAPDQVHFVPLRQWRSPHTGVSYPVSERVRVGSHEWLLEPLMDDQEFDARLTSGARYWEGAVRATVPGGAGGRGYLELTGYDRPLSLR